MLGSTAGGRQDKKARFFVEAHGREQNSLACRTCFVIGKALLFAYDDDPSTLHISIRTRREVPMDPAMSSFLIRFFKGRHVIRLGSGIGLMHVGKVRTCSPHSRL